MAWKKGQTIMYGKHGIKKSVEHDFIFICIYAWRQTVLNNAKLT